MRNNTQLESIIQGLIDRKVEGDYWDFKQEWHKDSEKLLHDIICFSNTAHNYDCYIIIGVNNKGKFVEIDDANRRKQAELIDMLYSTSFAGDNVPEISVETVNFGENEVDVLIIYDSSTVPYYLKKTSNTHKKLGKGFIYTRTYDKNTPINQNSTMQQIEMLWRKRLGLTQSALNQIATRLNSKSEWQQYDNTYYNIYKPDFVLLEEDEEQKLKEMFYMYTQLNHRFLYSNLKIKNHNTTLMEVQLVSLDSGRFKTPVSDWGFVRISREDHNPKYSYKYYLMDSMQYALQTFLYDDTNMETKYAKERYDEVILYFMDEKEKNEFEQYLKQTDEKTKRYLIEADAEYFDIDSGNNKADKQYKIELSTGLALKKTLIDFRKIEK